MKESWRPIKDFENYEISNMGRVRNKHGRIMKIHTNQTGYRQVPMSKDGKGYLKCVHKLVAEAFIDNPRGCTEVNHIDEDKSNNRADNLEWCTHQENILHGTCIKRAVEKRKERYPARKILAIFPDNSTRCFASASVASKELGIDESGIRTVLSGNRQKYLGTRWLYMKN